MKTKTLAGIANNVRKSVLAIAASAAFFAAEAKADDSYERDNFVSAEIGMQDNNLQNGYDFTEGWQTRFRASGAFDIYTDLQLALSGNAELALLRFPEKLGYDTQLAVDASILCEWAPRWETAALNLGAGVRFDYMNEHAIYEYAQLETRVVGTGPMIDVFVGSEWVYAGLNFSTAFGGMGNNVQQYNDLVQYNLALTLGFHLGPVDIEGYASWKFNTAFEGNIPRENVFVNAGANARFWVAENIGLTAGYNYLWAYGDTDHVEGNKFNTGLMIRW